MVKGTKKKANADTTGFFSERDKTCPDNIQEDPGEVNYMKKSVTVKTLLQEVEKINVDRIKKYISDYSINLNQEKKKQDEKENAEKLINYARKANKDWDIGYALVDKEGYISGWEMAESQKPKKVTFLEDRIANKRESFIKGYADRMYFHFVDGYTGSSLDAHIVTPVSNNKQKNKEYTDREIKLAYYFMSRPIHKDDAKWILKKYRSKKNKSVKALLSKHPLSSKDKLIKPSGKPSQDKSLLRSLKNAKWLIECERRWKGSVNKTQAVSHITSAITEFEDNIEKYYQD